MTMDSNVKHMLTAATSYMAAPGGTFMPPAFSNPRVLAVSCSSSDTTSKSRTVCSHSRTPDRLTACPAEGMKKDETEYGNAGGTRLRSLTWGRPMNGAAGAAYKFTF